MIKGAIEVASRTLVSGWIYSDAENLTSQLVMAFVGGTCVGSGSIDYFRKDLQQASLGDGYNGFYFPVKLADADDPAAIVVRLKGCDAVLLQSSSRVISASADQPRTRVKA